MSVLGVILARGGSKRLPGKNLRPLCGLPMIGWTIMAAKMASRLSVVVVSSDDKKIRDAASRCNVATITRPAELATDTASPYDAIKHAYIILGIPFDFICLLQPTSPLRTWVDIDACIELAHTTEQPAVVSFQERCDRPNGAVYVGRTEWVLTGGNFDTPGLTKYFMPPDRSVDVDTIEDFDRANAIMLMVA